MSNINIADVIKLPIAERIQLAEAIWDSVAEQANELPLPDWHKEILDERLANYESSTTRTFSWQEVKDGLKDSE